MTTYVKIIKEIMKKSDNITISLKKKTKKQKKKLGSRQQSINHSLCSYILDNCKHNRIATTRTQ